MAHKGLQRPCIDSAGRQGVSRSVAQHVGMYLEWQLSGLAKPLYELLGTIDGEGRLALDKNTKSAWGCSRRSARSNRSSSPCKPWMPGVPLPPEINSEKL